MRYGNISIPVLIAVIVLALLQPSSFGQSSESDVNIPQLIRDAYRNGAAMSRRIYEYTWTDTRTYRVVDRRGKVKAYPEQVYEVFPNRVSGRLLLRRLIKENGVPISPERAAKEQKRLAEEIEKDEREAEKANEKAASKKSSSDASEDACVPQGYATAYGANGGLITFSISDFLCAGEFSNPQRGTVRGREALILDFRPRADYKPPSKEREPIAKLNGRVWIDIKDRVVSRLEAWPAQDGLRQNNDKGQKNPAEVVLVYEQMRLEDGTWMHALTRINTTKYGSLFNGVTIEFQELFTDYKRFSSEVEGYQIGKPEK